MPFLALVHLRDLRCSECNETLAVAGARSFLVDENIDPINFSTDDPPEEMTVEIACSLGHETTLYVPNEISAEETVLTPDDAPIARDAVVVPTVP